MEEVIWGIDILLLTHLKNEEGQRQLPFFVFAKIWSIFCNSSAEL